MPARGHSPRARCSVRGRLAGAAGGRPGDAGAGRAGHR